MDKIFSDEKNYIETERENVFNLVRKSEETFSMCSLNLGKTFKTSFEKFRSTVQSCLSI